MTRYVTFIEGIDDFVIKTKLYELDETGFFMDEDGDMITPYDEYTGIQTDPDALVIEL